MLNELEEFRAYTEPPAYTATGKRDTSFFGRFTFDMMLDFEGLSRVLSIIARGYLFHNGENPYDRIDLARRVLCAWCSMPDNKKASSKADWQFKADFKEYHVEFPGLVDENGGGWFYRHVHAVADFMQNNPEKVSKTALEKVALINSGWDDAWRKKVMQFQVPIFSPETKGAWILRFDDILADALELGALREQEASFSSANLQRIETVIPEGVPTEVISTLIAYYNANKPEDSEWIVLPVTNFDAYFGNTNFSRKWLNRIPPEIMERQKQSFGVCRVRMRNILQREKTPQSLSPHKK